MNTALLSRVRDVSPFAHGFLAAGLDRRWSAAELTDAIVKSAALDGSVAAVWDEVFTKCGDGFAKTAVEVVETPWYRPSRLTASTAGRVLGAPVQLLINPTDPVSALFGWPTQELVRDDVEMMDRQHPEELEGTKVRLGGTDTLDDLVRLWKSKRTTLPTKLLGTIGVPFANLATSLGRADHYNPLTDTATIFGTKPGVTAHELGHAVDFNSGRSRLMRDAYIWGRTPESMLMRAVVPGAHGPLTLWQELAANRRALGAAQRAGEDQRDRHEARVWSIAAPSYGTYAGATAGALASLAGYPIPVTSNPTSNALLTALAGSIGGAGVGHIVAALRNRMAHRGKDSEKKAALTAMDKRAAPPFTTYTDDRTPDLPTPPAPTRPPVLPPGQQPTLGSDLQPLGEAYRRAMLSGQAYPKGWQTLPQDYRDRVGREVTGRTIQSGGGPTRAYTHQEAGGGMPGISRNVPSPIAFATENKWYRDLVERAYQYSPARLAANTGARLGHLFGAVPTTEVRNPDGTTSRVLLDPASAYGVQGELSTFTRDGKWNPYGTAVAGLEGLGLAGSVVAPVSALAGSASATAATTGLQQVPEQYLSQESKDRLELPVAIGAGALGGGAPTVLSRIAGQGGRAAGVAGQAARAAPAAPNVVTRGAAQAATQGRPWGALGPAQGTVAPAAKAPGLLGRAWQSAKDYMGGGWRSLGGPQQATRFENLMSRVPGGRYLQHGARYALDPTRAATEGIGRYSPNTERALNVLLGLPRLMSGASAWNQLTRGDIPGTLSRAVPWITAHMVGKDPYEVLRSAGWYPGTAWGGYERSIRDLAASNPAGVGQQLYQTYAQPWAGLYQNTLDPAGRAIGEVATNIDKLPGLVAPAAQAVWDFQQEGRRRALSGQTGSTPVGSAPFTHLGDGPRRQDYDPMAAAVGQFRRDALHLLAKDPQAAMAAVATPEVADRGMKNLAADPKVQEEMKNVPPGQQGDFLRSIWDQLPDWGKWAVGVGGVSLALLTLLAAIFGEE